MTNYSFVLSVAAASPPLTPSSSRLLPQPSFVMRPGSVSVRNAYMLLRCAACLCVFVRVRVRAKVAGRVVEASAQSSRGRFPAN